MDQGYAGAITLFRTLPATGRDRMATDVDMHAKWQLVMDALKQTRRKLHR
jgi:hypothetical protein